MGGSTLRGGQTVFHGIRMWGQLLNAAVVLAGALAVAVPAWSLWRSTTGYEWYASAILTVAEAKLGLGYRPDHRQRVRRAGGGADVLTLADIAASGPAHAVRRRILEALWSSAWLGVKASGALVAGFLLWFWIRGAQLARRHRIRGAELVSARALRARIQPLPVRLVQALPLPSALRPYRIAGVPFPHRTETQHTIVSGTTGAGKTVLIADLVAQVRARGERCVLYDKMGSYTRAFFDPARDVLLNPLDARAPRWSPFLEARTPRDFDMMAAALIPQQKDTVDPFWVTAARQLFANGAAVLWAKGVTENRVLVEHLLKTELTALAEAMEGTVAQSIVDPENPKTALSVRAMLTANIGALELLADTGPPFSIRDWVERDDAGGFLFLTSRGDQHASLRGLISTWLEIAVSALLSLPHDDARRIWLVLDELPTLHQVPSLQPGLAESRQFGGCFVLGVQVASALRDLYGRNGAETISGLCGTRVVLAAPDRDTAQWSADSLGRSEVEEVTEGVSYGANTIRDGVSLTPRRELRSLALPSEIMRLANLAGYLKLPGPLPVAEIKLKYKRRPSVAARFVPRETAPGPGGPGAAGAGPAETDTPSGDARPAPERAPAEDAPERKRATPRASKPSAKPTTAGRTRRATGGRPATRPLAKRPAAPSARRRGDAPGGRAAPEPAFETGGETPAHDSHLAAAENAPPVSPRRSDEEASTSNEPDVSEGRPSTPLKRPGPPSEEGATGARRPSGFIPI